VLSFWYDDLMAITRRARDRVRAELVFEIKAEARRQLSERGASELSLRAVARELGMASSAIYRYFPSRDDLLTALIIDAYESLGERAERAGAGVPPEDHRRRWCETCEAIRAWALANPNEYALIYGSPVPGYVAPRTTVGPAVRVALALLGPIRAAAAAGRLRPESAPPPSPALIAEARRAVGDIDMPELPPSLFVRAVTVWGQVMGVINLELFGHLEGVFEDKAPLYSYSVRMMADLLGLKPGGPALSEPPPREKE
jgi:AcrR family transcriptional regulator